MADKNHWSGKSFSGATWDVYQGDALQVLKKLPSEHFNCAITSPPYYWLRDYGVSGQSGHEENVSSYVGAIADVMDEVYRLLTDDGLLFLNLGDTYYSGACPLGTRTRSSAARGSISGRTNRSITGSAMKRNLNVSRRTSSAIP